MTPAFEQKTMQTACPYCGVGCGVDVTCNNKTPDCLAGSQSHPANFGKLCIKGTNLLQTTDMEGRLLYPQMAGERVGWTQATSEIANQFNRIIRQHGPDAVAFYVSGQLLTEDYYVANKLMKGFIGSANIDTNSRLCMSSAVAAHKRAFGSDTVPCNYEDIELTELLILVGSNASWTHPILFQRFMAAKQQHPNKKLIVIDPRRTATAEFADLHLSVKSGSDVALFIGLLHFLIASQAIDQDFIASHTQDWAQTKRHCADYAPHTVASLCGLPVEELLAFYQLFSHSPSAVSVFSQGVNQSHQGVDKCNAIINCHLATGKIGKPGNGPFSITGQPNAMGGREVGGLANMLAAHMELDNAEHRDWVQSFWQSPHMANRPGHKAVELFEAIKAGKVKAVWIMATNPLVSLVNRTEVADALRQCELVIVSDCVEHNDTLDFAHIKLPATTWGEKFGTVTNSERRISRQRAFMLAPGEAKHDWQIICEVARKMGFEQAFDYQHPADIFDEHAKLSGLNNGVNNQPKRDFDISALAGLSRRQYEHLQPVQWPVNRQHPCGRARMFDDGQFFTPSAKARFIPVYYQPPEHETRQEKSSRFVLNTGRYRDQWHTMTRTGKSSILAKSSKAPLLAIHPTDAKRLNIRDGQWLSLHNNAGCATLPCELDPGLTPGNLFAPIHWSGQNASDASVNQCFSSRVDPISGQPDSKHARVELTPIILGQYVHIFSQVKISLPLEFWIEAKLSHGYEYLAASKTEINQLLHWCKNELPLHGDWSCFLSDDFNAIVCQRAGALQCVAIFSHRPVKLISEWFEDLFAQSEITPAQLGQVLTLATPDAYTQGKIVCSCHRVGEHQITKAILEDRLHNLQELGAKLKCGTNCGSCKGEIQSLLNKHASNEKTLTIPINASYS